MESVLKKSFVEVNVDEYLECHGIKEDKDLKIEHVKEIANTIAGCVFSHGHVFCDIEGWLTWLYGVYLHDAVELLKKENVSDEEKSVLRIPEEFEYFAEKLLGFKYKDGAFIKHYDDKTHRNKNT